MKVHLFLDSGAYSVSTGKAEVNLQEYIDFIKKYEHQLEVYVNLDVINDPVETWRNQEEMERQGLHPLPIYHAGEPEIYFQRIMEYDYFGIGGVAGAKQYEYDILFKAFCPKENDFYPVRKVHGFGQTQPKLLARYPWYSVDSSSWLQHGAYGKVLIPRKRYGEYRYDISPLVISVTSFLHKVDKGLLHTSNMSSVERDVVLEYFGANGFELGKSELKWVDGDYEFQENERIVPGTVRVGGDQLVEVVVQPGLCNDHHLRHKLNIVFFEAVVKSIPEWPWQFKPKMIGRFGR